MKETHLYMITIKCTKYTQNFKRERQTNSSFVRSLITLPQSLLLGYSYFSAIYSRKIIISEEVSMVKLSSYIVGTVH